MPFGPKKVLSSKKLAEVIDSKYYPFILYIFLNSFGVTPTIFRNRLIKYFVSLLSIPGDSELLFRKRSTINPF